MIRRLLPLIPTTLALSACSTPFIQVSTSPTIPSVPCVSIPELKYHAPKIVGDIAKWEAGDTFQGQYDRPDTVHAIRENNAAIGAVCVSK